MADIQVLVNGEFLRFPSMGLGGVASLGAALPIIPPRISLSIGMDASAYLLLPLFVVPSFQLGVGPEVTARFIMPNRRGRTVGIRAIGRLALYLLYPEDFTMRLQAGIFFEFGSLGGD